jgi:hypothetical protein
MQLHIRGIVLGFKSEKTLKKKKLVSSKVVNKDGLSRPPVYEFSEKLLAVMKLYKFTPPTLMPGVGVSRAMRLYDNSKIKVNVAQSKYKTISSNSKNKFSISKSVKSTRNFVKKKVKRRTMISKNKKK